MIVKRCKFSRLQKATLAAVRQDLYQIADHLVQ